MTVGIDACLQELSGQLYDIQIGIDGDILSEDFFDSAIIVSMFAERRANESEVLESRARRGWIGNESTPDFEIGSKLWLYEQSRLTSSVISGIGIEVRKSLQWLVDDGFAESIDAVLPIVTSTGVNLEVTIRRPNSLVDKRHFVLWDNTPSVCPESPRVIILTASAGMNIFTAAGSPTKPVDVIVNVLTGIALADVDTISTGIGWHQDSRITIHISPNASIIGGGGSGGIGGHFDIGADALIGGGGGGGAGLGDAGTSSGGFNDGAAGSFLFGGIGGIGTQETFEVEPDLLVGGNGLPGKAALVLNHNVTIQNFSFIAAGGGGGGGGGFGLGNDGGGGGNFGEAGSGGLAVGGFGGAGGKAIITNGFNIIFAPEGPIIGDVT